MINGFQTEVVLLRRLLLGCAFSAVGLATAYGQAVRVDSSIPSYSRSSGVSTWAKLE